MRIKINVINLIAKRMLDSLKYLAIRYTLRDLQTVLKKLEQTAAPSAKP